MEGKKLQADIGGSRDRDNILTKHISWIKIIDNSIVYVTEGQNITAEIAKLIISRIGDNSELWLNFDLAQFDMKVFETNSGVRQAIDRLKGNPLFGYVRLQKIERSAVAQLAGLLD